jgi:uncharacterized protein YjiS (DUF1127 family)
MTGPWCCLAIVGMACARRMERYRLCRRFRRELAQL